MRRPNGTGSIIKLSGNRRLPYAVRIPSRDKYGRVRQQYLSYHRTPGEAQQALDKYNVNRAASAAPPPDKLSMTLQEVYDSWSAREYQRAGDASVRSRKASWKRLSALKQHKMRAITVDHLQEIIDEVARETGIRPSTINELYHEIAERVSFDHLDKICEALHCSLDELVEYIPNQKPHTGENLIIEEHGNRKKKPL